jgi:predicted SAM-dependent methyltransferase
MVVRERYRVKKCAQHSPVRIVIGASDIFENGWIPTDIEYLNLLIPDHWQKTFQRNSIDAILAEHVWEHLTIDDGLVAARQCYEYLKPGGYLRVAVPDGFHPNPKYINYVKVGGTGLGAQDHKVLFTYETLRDVFSRAGFRVELLEYFDSDGKFHSVNWDPRAGRIRRSQRFDERNVNGELQYTSIILDAYKDAKHIM